jgi:transcriptional regulator with XRE-family HTH domain
MDEIKRVMKRLSRTGLRQTDISERSGVPEARLSRWMNGKSIPRAANDALVLHKLVNEVEAQNRAEDEAAEVTLPHQG